MYEIKGKYTTAKVFTEVEDIDVTTQTIAICDHPIFQDCKIRIMPDCHKGKGCTIGFTAEMPKSHQIIPNIIGVDQFCGMLVIKLDDNDITNNYEKLDKVIRRNIPFGRDGRQKFSELVPEEFVEKTKKISKDILKDNFINHINKIGSLGGGNHFISIEKGSTGTYLIIHSGSRNIGLKLAIHYQNLAIERNCYGDGELKQLSFLTDKDARNYLACAEYCQEYAKLNRKIMAHDIMVGMRWKSKETFETVHNYIGEDNIIRKGAISCCKDEKVLIPLNMAEGSLICIGTNALMLKGNDISFRDGFVMTIQGVLLAGFGFLLAIAFAFYLMDAVVQLGIVGALMPFLIACWPFEIIFQEIQIS